MNPKKWLRSLAVCLCVTGLQARAADKNEGMVLLPAGSYLPFFGTQQAKDKEKRQPVHVKSFWLDKFPVTNADFLKFLKDHPEWRKSQVKPLFTDNHYLVEWKSDLTPPKKEMNSPATDVSWFVAKAYCESLGKSLPTTDQWEYAADDHGKGSAEAKERVLNWYSNPNPKVMPPVGSTPKNGFGVYDLYGLVWEWTLDFNDAMMTPESREQGTKENSMFCGSGSLGALDSTDYVSFMRYSFRNSLKATYTVNNLGFRCAKDAN